MTDEELAVRNEVLDYLALAAVAPNVSKKTKEALAYVAFRVSRGGLPPFPSQVKETVGQLESRGSDLNARIAAKIQSALGGGS